MARPRSFSRIRKRTFVVTGLTTLAVLLVAGLLMLYAILQAGPDDLVTVTINEGQSRTAVLGSGISLDQADASGMLRDASFEPLIFRQTLTIYSGDATTLTVSSEEASSGQFGDGFFDGAAARVMSRTDDGLVLKKTAKVLNYGINRVGIFTDVNLPGDMPAGFAILAFARSGDVSLAVGEQGLIITNVSGQTPQIAESGLASDLTGVCATDSGYLVCSADGDLLASADGQSWQIIAQYPGKPLRAIAATPEGLYVAVGDAGTIIVGQGDVSTPLQPLTSASLTDIACSGESFTAVGEDGTILTSRTGVLWQSRNISAETDWLATDYRDGRFVTTGSAGAIAISDDGILFTLLTHNAEASYTDIVMLSRRQLIVLDENGGFAISNDSGATWLSSSIQTGMHSMVISLAGKDKILSADDRGSLGLAQLVAEIQLDSALKDSQYQAGDLIFLEKATMSIPDSYLAANTAGADYQDPWQHFGPGSSTRVFGEASPGGGQASMLLNSDPGMTGKTTIVSQVIDTAKLGNSTNDLYEIELWMKQSEINDRSVRVWLTGPFKSVGTVFANVGTTWKKYSITFFLPISSDKLPSGEVRINIGIDSGSLWIDQTSLSLAADTSQLLAGNFTAEIKSIAPQLIRLGFLNIGGPVARQESWAYQLGNETASLDDAGWRSQSTGSLHAALQLVADCGADPWLVIDSNTSQAELLNMIEYIAGPISETYGKLRMDQGSVVPWTDRFNRIIIEIIDSSDTFDNDQLKADFVNLLISDISRSPYYRQIKGQLVFVDGMDYSAGVVLSTADYHATDLDGVVQANRAQGLQDAFMAYYDKIPRNPEKQSQNWPELMRTASLRANGIKLPTLAELTAILLGDLGEQSAISNLALPARSSQDWQQTWPSAAAIASACAKGIPLDIAVTSDDIIVSGFESDQQISLALNNLTDSLATCRLVTDLPLQGATVYKYDAKGQLISKVELRSAESRLTILSGGVVLIVKTIG